jgi:hypothetical protein
MEIRYETHDFIRLMIIFNMLPEGYYAVAYNIIDLLWKEKIIDYHIIKI